MQRGKLLNYVNLTNPQSLETLVENRRVFSLQNCELNIFESYQQAYMVPLTFNDFIVTSMVRGKKIMHLADKNPFDYLPGETVIVPGGETMQIDFPEATEENPTQCIALAVDESYIRSTLGFLNEYYNNEKDSYREWKLQFNEYHFYNDNEVSELINKLIRICSSNESTKNIYADLSLKELLVRLVQSQYLQQVRSETLQHSNQGRWQYVLDYIHKNLSDKIQINELSSKSYLNRSTFFRLFKEQFGITPVEYINRERLRLAKHLLADTDYNVTEISWQTGFTDVNYFVRLFKKTEGITPGSYRSMVKNACYNKDN